MAHWIGVQGQSKLVKNSKTPPLCHVPSGESQTQIKHFLLIETGRLVASVEGLNSSLAMAAGELLPKKCQPL